MELSAVELVTFLHDRQIARLGWERRSVEVGVLEGVDRIDPLFPVESHQFSEESDGTRPVSVTSSVESSSRAFDEGTDLAKRLLRSPGRGRGLMSSAPGRCLQPGMLSSVGVPHRSKMISSWWLSLSPANIGLPHSISPNTHLATGQYVAHRASTWPDSPNSPHVNSSGILLKV